MGKNGKPKWYNVFYRDCNVEGGPVKVHAPGLIIMGVLLIGIVGGILALSGWTCAGCTKKPITELRKKA